MFRLESIHTVRVVVTTVAGLFNKAFEESARLGV